MALILNIAAKDQGFITATAKSTSPRHLYTSPMADIRRMRPTYGGTEGGRTYRFRNRVQKPSEVRFLATCSPSTRRFFAGGDFRILRGRKFGRIANRKRPFFLLYCFCLFPYDSTVCFRGSPVWTKAFGIAELPHIDLSAASQLTSHMIPLTPTHMVRVALVRPPPKGY